VKVVRVIFSAGRGYTNGFAQGNVHKNHSYRI
jgi:hypothetical protein